MSRSFFKNIFVVVSVLIFFVSSSTPVYAVSAGFELIPCSGTEAPDPGAGNGHECTFNDLVLLAQNVAKKIVQLGLIVSPLIFAYAGYLLLTSSDSPKQRDDAKKIAWNVVKGIVVMMLAWLFVDLILKALLNSTVTLPWG